MTELYNRAHKPVMQAKLGICTLRYRIKINNSNGGKTKDWAIFYKYDKEKETSLIFCTHIQNI